MAIEAHAADGSLMPSGMPLAEPSGSQRRRLFVGPHGIRVGWRILMFIAIFAALGAGTNFTMHHIPAVQAWQKTLPKDGFVPSALLVGEGLSVLMLIIAALVMTKVEKKTFRDYGLPLREALGKRFWQGAVFGLGMLSLLMASIAVFHGFSVGGLALSSAAALRYGLLYGLGFLFVGIFEEFSFRGYLQATLGEGISFWPAAIVLSVLFGAIHLRNSGEAISGAVMAGSFGVLAAFTLWRTGSIWFAIGMHAAFDWGETYLYSVADSGFKAQGHLLQSSFHGPTWLTGGTVGPEGSVFALLILLLAAVAVHILFPPRKVNEEAKSGLGRI
jgi:uncharacterized protein